MSKMKKVLLICTTYVLVAALAIGGTLAYLTSTDSDVNVMTLGNVSIAQHEYQRADGVAHDATASKEDKTLVPFVQGQALYPAVPSADDAYSAMQNKEDCFKWGDYVYSGTAWNGLWDDSKLSNVMDKMVFVENTGDTDAYVRTIIAYECPNGMTVGDAGAGDNIGVNYNSVWTEEEIGKITVGDVEYAVYSYTYTANNGVLAAGNTAHPSLLQVVMNHEMDNEDVAKFGKTYDILVVSQAVQSAGFADAQTALDAAFGDITTANHPWVDGVKLPEVVDENNIDDALAGGKDVILGDDIEKPANNSNAYGKTAITVNAGQTLDGANNSFAAIGATGTWDSAINITGGTIKNVTITKGFRGIFVNHNAGADLCGHVTLENVVIDGPVYTLNCDQGTNNGLTAINSTFNGWTSYSTDIGDVKFIDCSFGEGAGYSFCRPYAPTKFVGCDFEAGYEIDPRAAITFENCTIGGVALTADNLATLVTSNIHNAAVK